MKDRTSFIIHYDSLDVLDELDDKQTADLLKAMRDYNKTGKHSLTGIMKAVFIPFKNQFDRDFEKYAETCNKNKINGSKGGRPKKPNGLSKNPTEAKKPYNDNVLLKKETKGEKIDFDKLKDFFNITCKDLASIKTITKSRKSAINARIKETSKDDFIKVITLASKSKFLNGDNDRGWKADFDWIIKPSNYIRILEGNYNREVNNNSARIEIRAPR